MELRYLSNIINTKWKTDTHQRIFHNVIHSVIITKESESESDYHEG